MPFAHGSVAEFTIGSVPTDISEYLESLELAFERDAVDVLPLGSDWASSLPGVRRANGTASGYFDPTLDTEVYNAWNGDTDVAFAYYPQGNSVGNPKYSGNVRITSYSISTASGDAGRANFSFASQGTVSRGTA